MKPKYVHALDQWAMPETKEQAIALLSLFNANEADIWHFDDNAVEFYGAEEGSWRNELVERLNKLFADGVMHTAFGKVINAGAWHAAGVVNWAGLNDGEQIE